MPNTNEKSLKMKKIKKKTYKHNYDINQSKSVQLFSLIISVHFVILLGVFILMPDVSKVQIRLDRFLSGRLDCANFYLESKS